VCDCWEARTGVPHVEAPLDTKNKTTASTSIETTMMRAFLLLLTVFCICFRWCEGFAIASPAFAAATRRNSLVVLSGMAQPDIQIKTTTTQETKTRQKVIQKEVVKTGDPISRRDEEFEDPPMFKLMLLGDEGYDKEHGA
jgi:hypothetical protein